MQDGFLTLGQKDQWNKYLSRMPEAFQDVYLSPEYYALYQTPGRQAQCFFVEDGDDILLYPYLKTHLNKIVDFVPADGLFDIEGAYGYNGFAVKGGADFVRRCVQLFSGHCRRQGIIAEFVRLNPVLPIPVPEAWWEVKLVNGNVAVDLRLSEAELWKNSYEHCVRKNINRARKEGLTVSVFTGGQMDDGRLEEFLRIYNHTMQRHDADGEYYFSQTYFRQICASLSQNSLFAFAYLNGQAVSCELVLMARLTAYSFLGGTMAEAQAYRPNNLLKHELIVRLRAMGLEQYVLGGGKTQKDGIYQYKRTFAKDGHKDFFIGCKVHDQGIYDELCRRWQSRNTGKDCYKNYFLKYHY